jgi:hypothetical protein
MPLQKIVFKPGIDKETTSYMNEGGFYSCDKIRFRSGSAEKLGGWANQAPNYTFYGVPRDMFNWVTYDSQNLLGVGTSQKYYIQNAAGSQYHDITPVASTATLGTNPFSTTLNSKLVTVTATAHGQTVNSFVTYTNSGTVTVGGVTVASVAGVEYEIINIVDANTYQIIASSAATSTAVGGTGITATYQLNAGAPTYTTGSGWGGSTWSSGGWGGASTITTNQQLRLWSADKYEQDLVFNPRGGTLYYWAYVDASTFNRAVTLAAKANSTTKYSSRLVTGTSGTNLLTISAPDSSDFIDIGAVVTDGTSVPANTLVTAVAGNVITLSNNLTGNVTSGTLVNFSYAGKFVPNTTNFVISSNAQHFTICFGANPYDPTNATTTFDPMLVRWSDQDNPWDFVPTTFNQSGEQHLANGSYLICAKNTRQEVLVFSDSALFSMQYLGPPYVWGFNLLMDNISIAGPDAVVTVNNMTFWMGMDKFFIYNGTVSTLPCTLRRWVFNNINKDQLYQVVCGSNEGFNEVWWHYPSENSQVNDSYIIYNYLENLWYYGSLNRSGWLDSPTRPYPMGSFGVQTSFLATALTATATSMSILNGFSYPNSGVVIIGSEQIAYTGVTNNTLTGLTRGYNSTTAASHVAYSTVTYYVPNQVMYHEYGIDDNTASTGTLPIAASVESADFDIGDGEHFMFVWRMLPDLTFTGSDSTVNPVVYLTVKPRDASGSTYKVAPSPAVTGVTNSQDNSAYTPIVYTRVRGRQAAFRMASTDIGTNWQMGAMRLDMKPDGRR